MLTTYTASAGSGKTTNLVAEYLSLSLPNPDKYKNILAITFTNNATAEMKSRIIQALESIAFENGDRYTGSTKAIYQLIVDKLSVKPTLHHVEITPQWMRQHAQKLLNQILYDYNNFSISTIDSFFQRLIRSFAFDLELNVNFSVQVDLDELYTQTVDMMLSEISERNKELSDRLITLLYQNLDETGSWNIEHSLIKMLQATYNEESYEPIKSLTTVERSFFYASCKEMQRMASTLRKAILMMAKEGEQLIVATGLEAQHFVNGSRGVCTYFAKLQSDLTKSQGKFMKDDSFVKKGRLLPEMHEKLCRLLNEIGEKQALYQEYRFLAKNITPLELAFDLRHIMDEIKLRDNLFFLSEANAKVFENIKDQDTPFLYEKLGARYSCFLIDEFQDTSQMQWDNIKPLIANALSSQVGYEETGSCSLFGDVKQAIYRFRNGEAATLNKLSSAEGFVDEFALHEDYKTHFQAVALNSNYRSARAIIQFNNSFFSFLKECRLMADFAENYYKNHEQITPISQTTEGYVKVNFITKEQLTQWQTTYEEQEEMLVLEAVNDALERGYRYQDIAILTSGKSKGASLGKMLALQNIPVISSDSLLFIASREVTLIVATLQYINNAKDDISKLFMIHYLNESTALASPENVLIATNDLLFRQFLQQHCIDINREKLIRLPLFTMIKETIHCYGVRLTAPNLFVTGFLDIALTCAIRQSMTLDAFLQWWAVQSDKLSINPPSGINAVTITTIHKSKGLQYPIVIIPMRKWSSRLTRPNQWIKNPYSEPPYLNVDVKKEIPESWSSYYQQECALSLLDKINLIYVAQTRAQEGLCIITGDPSVANNYSGYMAQFLQSQCQKERLPQEEEAVLDFDQAIWNGDSNFVATTRGSTSENATMITQLHISPFSFSQADISFKNTALFKTEEQTTGIAIHDYLSQLIDFPATESEIEQLPIAGDKRLQQLIRNALNSLLRNPDIAPYFSREVKVLNECDIIDEDGKIYRPDRIVFLENEVMVIDYKTGQPNEKYQQQLDLYIQLLEKMGYQNVKGKLLYLEISEP